jgi:predicted DNA-binding transcriptional regulator AlpA
MSNKQANKTPKRFLRRAEVALRYGVTRRCIIQWEDSSRLPKPIYIGARTPVHDEEVLEKMERAAMKKKRGAVVKDGATAA